VEKYGRVRQAADDNRMRHMRIAWWVNKATDTHSEYLTLIQYKPTKFTFSKLIF